LLRGQPHSQLFSPARCAAEGPAGIFAFEEAVFRSGFRQQLHSRLRSWLQSWPQNWLHRRMHSWLARPL